MGLGAYMLVCAACCVHTVSERCDAGVVGVVRPVKQQAQTSIHNQQETHISKRNQRNSNGQLDADRINHKQTHR